MDDLSNRLNEIFSSPDGMEKIRSLVTMLQNSGGSGAGSPGAGGPGAGGPQNVGPQAGQPWQGNPQPAPPPGGPPPNGPGQSGSQPNGPPPSGPPPMGARPGPSGPAANGSRPNGSQPGGLGFDPAMLLTLQRAFSTMQKGDPRIDLLMALRENLGEERRHKVDEAVQIMRLLNLLPLLREQGLFGGGGNGPEPTAK